MQTNAENGTPMLSSTDDSRITPFGKFMRKTRLDEIPQFYNVLKGEMSTFKVGTITNDEAWKRAQQAWANERSLAKKAQLNQVNQLSGNE
jgi:lipopolysaccharide/colanic/teichoic acid biosynthesis glycosyltransferase